MATNQTMTVESEAEKLSDEKIMATKDRVNKINDIWREVTPSYRKFHAICDDCGLIEKYGSMFYAERACKKHEGYKKYSGHIAHSEFIPSFVKTNAIAGTKANIQRNCDLERFLEDPENQKLFTLHSSDLVLCAFVDEIAYQLKKEKDPNFLGSEYFFDLKERSNAIERELRRRKKEDEVAVGSIAFPIELSKTIKALPEVIVR